MARKPGKPIPRKLNAKPDGNAADGSRRARANPEAVASEESELDLDADAVSERSR